MIRTPYLTLTGLAWPPLKEHGPFHEACTRHELRMQRCGSCMSWRHPPAPACPRCGSTTSQWDLVTGAARLFSYTVVHHASSLQLKLQVPYNIAIVEFQGMADARLISNVIDALPGQLHIGMSLWLVWQDNAQGRPLPLFSSSPNG
jgi:hypothetical protein